MHNDTCKLIANYISSFSDPLYTTVDEFDKRIKKNARREYRRAKNKGYEVNQLIQITDLYQEDIKDIFRSKPIRQKRQITYLYGILGNGAHDIFKGWPIPDYSIYTCPHHYFEFYGCFLDKKLVAYLETVCSNGVAGVHSTMGHAKHLENGVMKYLFIEVIKQNTGKNKYFQYLNYETKGDQFHFVDDLGITTHNNPQLLITQAKGDL